MKLFEYIKNFKLFTKMVNNGYISIVDHPTENLQIINYTKKCQAEKVWNDATIKSRGIIINSITTEIVALPFKKFFNYEEIEDKSEIPDLPYSIYNKLDGSLGILYWINDIPYIATKGSFVSEQALHATKILHTKYKDCFNLLNRNITYLFEIIYPEDLHCISYKDTDDIFLIGEINRFTDEEYDIYDDDLPFPKAEHINFYFDNWVNIREYIDGSNKEGFVIKFSNNYRIKLKYESYWKLHYTKSGFTAKKILAKLKEGKTDEINETIKIFDEEQQIYFKKILNNILDIYNKIIDKCISEIDDKYFYADNKTAAEYIKTCTYPSIMFAIKNKKDINKSKIWDYVENSLKLQ